MEIYEFSSSSSMIDIDEEEEEKSYSCNNVNKVKNKKRCTSSGKREYFSSSDSSDAQNEGSFGSKKKKIRKKIRDVIEPSTVGSSIKSRSDKTKPAPSLKPSHDTGAFGFESEAIFSQVLKCENESVFSGEDSDQTVKSSCDDVDKKAHEEKVSARVPFFNLTISDEEMETDDGLPKLVRKHKKHDKSNASVVKDTAKSESGYSMFNGKGRKLCKHDIEDKEFWSDQEMTSSDDDVPILQLNPQNLNVSSDAIKCVEPLEEVTKCNSKEIQDKTSMEQNQILTSSKISSDFSSFCSKKLSQQSSTYCKQKLQMAAESSTQLNDTSESEVTTNDVHVESDDETQPYDDFDLPDLSPLHGEEQSTNLKTEREHSPDIFNEEDSPDCLNETIYTQMDDCIYIEDSDEENLSQSLFQQEVKLELDDSSEDEVYLVDEEDESWRDILSLDDSDDDNITHNGRVHEMTDPDKTTDSVFKVATQVDADPYAGATQVITDDSYSSATQIDSKNMYLSETQVDKSDPYSSATQMDHDLHSSESDDDIYNAATQVDVGEVKVRKTKKLSKGQDLVGRFAGSDSNDESLKYEGDPYATATQVDLPSPSAMKMIKNKILKATKKMDPYMCATQCDKDSYVYETQVDQMDPYTGATQIDSLSRKSPKNSISSPSYEVGSEKDLFNEPTQKEASGVDSYDLATQVDSANQGQLSNYNAETEAFFDSDDDDIILLSETESPEAIELSQNQTENKACVVTETCAELQSKSEKIIICGGIKNEKSTDVIELATGSDEDEDGRKTKSKIPESMDTKFKRGNQKDRNDDLYEMDTQVVEHKETVQNEDTRSSESWSDMEFYEVDTQLDSLSELKKTVPLKETSPTDTKSEPQKTVAATGKSVKDTSDQSDHLLLTASSSSHMTSCSKTAAKSSMLPESSEQSSSDFEIVSDDGNKRKTWVNSYHHSEKCQTKTTTKESEFLSIKVRSANEEMPAENKSRSSGHFTNHVPEFKPEMPAENKSKSSGHFTNLVPEFKPEMPAENKSKSSGHFTNHVPEFKPEMPAENKSRSSGHFTNHVPEFKPEMPAENKSRSSGHFTNHVPEFKPEMPAENKSRSSGHFTNHVPEFKRTISTNQKTAIPISPQRQKSTKEKREEFKITSFYSKKQMDSETSGRVGRSENAKAETFQKKRSSVPAKTTPDAGWLSKTSGKISDRKRNRTASGGGTHAKKRKDEVISTVSTDALIKAKAEMIARSWIRPLVPEPVKKPTIDTKSDFTDDVRMPELDEVIKKQLPLMDDRLLHPQKTKQDDVQVSSDSGDTTVGSKAKSSIDSSGLKENQMEYSSEYKKSNSRSGSKDRDGKNINGAEICVNDSKKTIQKDIHHSKQHKSSSIFSSVDSDKSRGKTVKEKDTQREKDNTRKSTSWDKDSSKQSHSMEKDSSRRSTSKDKDSSTKSSSKEKDSSRRSTSKDKDSSTKSSSKEKDSSKRSSSKDKDSATKSSSKDSSRRSTSTSKDKDLSSTTSSSKGSSGRSTSKDEDNLTKGSSTEKENSIRSTSTNKESSRKSSSKDKDSSRRSTSMDKDVSSQSSSIDKDKSRSSSKENVSRSNYSRGSTSKDEDRSKYSKSKTKDNSGRSSSKERSNSLDKGVSKSSSVFCSNHSDILNSSTDRNRIESEALENTAHSEILPFVFNSKTAPDNSESSSVSLKAGDGSETHRMEIYCEQDNKIQEEEMEDVKLGKLAKAAAIEKPLPSSQDQPEEDDDTHVIIIDDEEEIDEEKTSWRKAPGSAKNTSEIKSILNKKLCTFFADRNDESTRKGQLIKFKLAPDRVPVRTQRYIDSLIQKKKGGVKSVETNRPPTIIRPPLHPLSNARRMSATATSHSPSNIPQLPTKMAAHSSMDSSCVSVLSRPARSSASGGPGPDRSSSQNVDHCSQFFSHLLKWNPTWFLEADKARDKKEQRKAYEPPPVSPTVYPIPEKFNSYQDYVNIFIPHLLQEAWEQSYQSWSQLKALNSYPQICAVYSGVERSSTTSSSQTFEKYTWYSITTKDTYEAMRKNDHLGEKFLVIIKDYGHYLKSKDREIDQKYYQPNYFDQIGYIEKIQLHSRPGSLGQTINTFKVLGTDPAARQKGAVVLRITVLSRRRPLFKHLLDKLSFIQPVASLVTIVRQFQAVSFLPRSPVCKHILLPGRQDVFYEKVTISESVKHSLKHYNESQRLAICTASQMILGDPQSPKIGLLQGPPGTGKSSTVVGIVEKVLQFLGSNARICLCAPSNNAVDLLIKRLDDHRKKMVNTEFASALSIVRIGNAECVHRDVKKFRLSDIIQEECIKWRTEKKKENIPRSVLENYHELKRRREELQELRRQRQGHREEVVRIDADLEKLGKRITDMEKNHFKQINDITLSRPEEEQIKRGILQRATIVCGTLSAFGQPFVSNLLRNSARRGKPIFDCIIVDEASQANELDCIIPLQYQANKLILVGDPEQLPPTIKSSKAAQNYFGQSLFERFYRHFQSSTTNMSPILMLDTQYRMHPDIAYWPSQYIYQGKLKTDRSVINRYKQNARLKPFVLFDVQDSHEHLSQTTGSVNNPTEVEFIVQLVLVILRSTRPQHVGIIAPYKSQKHLLSTSLAKKGVRNIEISTVDGFQGQEKEVIIFSCVRAQNQSKSIGFMADKKRMNVALTRAKSALYIVAHMDSLKEANADWRNMIEDAERRNMIYTVANTREFQSAVTQIVLKK